MDVFLRFHSKDLQKSYQREVDTQNAATFRLIKWFVVFVVVVEYAFKIYQRIRDGGPGYIALDFVLVVAVLGGYAVAYIIKKKSKKFDMFIDFIYFSLYCYGSFYITYDLFDENSKTRTGYEFVIMGIQSVWIQFFFFIVMKNWIYKCLLVAANILIISLRILSLDNYEVSGAVYLRAAVSAIYTIFLLYIYEKMKKVVFLQIHSTRNRNQTFTSIVKNIPEMILMLNSELIVVEKNNLIDKFFTSQPSTMGSIKMTQSTKLRETLDIGYSRQNTEVKLMEEEVEEESPARKSKLLVMRFSAIHKPKLRDQDLEKKFFNALFSEKMQPTLNIQSIEDIAKMETVVKDHDYNLYDILTAIARDPARFRRFLDEDAGGEFIVLDMKYVPDPDSNVEKGVEVKISIASFSSNASDSERIILILRDTTQRDLIARLEDNNSYKDALLASVSHELRTPLNTNINSLESMLSESLVPTEVKEQYVTPALINAKLLLNIINDILDLSQISSNRIKLYFEPKNIKETLDRCLTLVQYQARMKGLKLDIKIGKEVPLNICTDHARLSQVILNLLNNAIKFTYQGTITVTIGVEDGNVVFSFQDTGIGLTDDQIIKLRKMLLKMDANEKLAMRSTGAGLGLNISNLLAKMLGPSGMSGIYFESEIDKGSTFSFRIEEKPNAMVTLLSYHGGSKLRIKIGEEIIPYRTKQPYEVPNAQQIKLRMTQIHALTSNLRTQGGGEESIDNLSLAAENNELISKPIKTQDVKINMTLLESQKKLTSTIQQSLHNEEPKKSARKQQLQEQKTVDTTPLIDNKEKECTCPQVMVVDDEPFNVMTLEQLVSKWKKKCVTAFNGKDALKKIQQREGMKCLPGSPNCRWTQLILMDKNMPMMDGIETTTEIRKMISNGELENKFVVGNTAYVGQKEIDAFLEAGVQEILFKPLDKSKLEKVITKYLENNGC